MEDKDMMLSLDEQAILLGAIEADVSQRQIEKIFNWAKEARLNESILKLALVGCVALSWDDDRNELMVRITEFGKEVVHAI